MPIVAYCPECRSRYELHDNLLGKRIRCPDSSCGQFFTVSAAGEKPSEVEAPTESPVEEADWRSAPPPVQTTNGAKRKRSKSERYPVAEPAPQPVPSPIPKPASSPVARFQDGPPRRRGGWAVAFLVAFVGVLIGGGSWLFIHKLAQSEEALRTEAEREYSSGSYRSAARKYEELGTKFGRSQRAGEYRFYGELAAVRDAASRTPPEPQAGLDAATAFVQKYGRDPLLKNSRDDLAASAAAIVNEFVAQAQAAAASESEVDKAAALIERSRTAAALAERFPTRGINVAKLTTRIETAAATLNATRSRKTNVERVVALLKPPRPNLDAARNLIRQHRIGDDPAVRAALADAEKVAREVRYEPLQRPALTALSATEPSSVLLEPDAGGAATASGEVVFAVSRGLLYALDARNGRRLWAARVGPDSNGLPIRMGARGDDGEFVVIAGADPPSLTARDVRTGAVRWHQPLEAPLLGRPVLAGGQMFATTAGPAGIVYHLNPSDGLLRGRFATGQALAAGAAADAATGRLYVPAHGEYVYVFNMAPTSQVAGPAGEAVPLCEGLLPTGHAPGALRGEPIVVSSDDGVEVPRYLVLGETDGLDAMKLRAFRLLDKATVPGPTAEVRLSGWSWFAPYQDAEKMALVTDNGVLGLIGIQQKNNADPPIFPLLGRDAPPVATPSSPARSELVHAEEYGFWALVAGRLQHWRLGLDRRVGPKLTPTWRSSLALGSPVHASQVSRDRATLFLVTQTDSPTGHWVTAVDARTGRLVWQRPLGLTCLGDPIALGAGVVALDPAGSAYWFTSAAGGPFTPDGLRAIQPAHDLAARPQMLRQPDGESVIVLACRPEAGTFQLTMTTIEANREQRTRSISLPASLGGTAGVGPTSVIVPLADGSLARIPRVGDGPREIGPNWRALGSRADSIGHVTHWAGDTFLVNDGGRRLVLLHWPAGSQYALATEKAVELPARIVGAPALWAENAAAVADASGAVHLIRGAAPKIQRTWQVGSASEPVTAGPWIAGKNAFVVVGNARLVAIDPEKPDPIWSYTTDGNGLRHAPAWIDGRLIVADQSGTFVALDAATGAALGPAYRHPGETAAVAAPTPFGPGKFLAPLSDGSALVLPVSELLGR